MKNLSQLLQEYVERTTVGAVQFGRAEGEAPSLPAGRSEREWNWLVEKLREERNSNNLIIWLAVGGYVLLLLLLSSLVVLHQNDPKWVAAMLGGNLLSLGVVVAWIRDIWREKNYIDMLLAVLPTLTPEEAIKVVQSFYYEKVSRKAQPAKARPHPNGGETHP